MPESYFDQVISISSLLKSHQAAKKGKGKNRECILFDLSLSENVYKLHNRLAKGTYRISGYYSFKIYDPKLREVNALHYADRVVQHSLCDFALKPILEPHLIYDNAANRIGKGTDFARNRLKKFLYEAHRKWGSSFFYLKLDIHHYFDSIDHDLLKRKIKKYVKEEKLANMIDGIIDSFETEKGKGLPLGNQSSQWFGIFYLDGLDRLAKERLGIKGYIRYMDDIVILGETKKECEFYLSTLLSCLEELKLTINPKSGIFKIKDGLAFLGHKYRLLSSGRIVVTPSARVKKRFLTAANAQSIQSYFGYFLHSNSYQLRKRIAAKYSLKCN